MNKKIALVLVILLAVAGAIVYRTTSKSPATPPVTENTSETNQEEDATLAAEAATSMPKAVTDQELVKLADNKYASGLVPLGDNKYVTAGPKKGYVYLCNVRKDNPGSMVNGPWIQGTKWNFLKKISVDGAITWAEATFKIVLSTSARIFSGNGLPINHTTGVFPVASTDDASRYDPNPNTISAQALEKSLPRNPVYSSTPYCMGGEVGIMLSGVPLFNAFDAGLRDAPAHELQDDCDGHPQGSGQYHYHSLSSCFKDLGVGHVLGYALDGFPITGALVAKDKYLTTEDLDECHGIVSTISVDGKPRTTYHYVMTRDFPYSVSCFRGKPASLFVIGSGGGPSQGGSGATPQGGGGQAPQGGPPQEAYSACSGKSSGASCSFTDSHGTISGSCDTPPGMSSLVCVPGGR
jgi:hypothetical protein